MNSQSEADNIGAPWAIYRCAIKKIARLVLVVGCTGTAILIGCSSHLDVAGTGSQAGNGRVECSIVRADGSAASMARVTLRRKDYLADTAVGPLLKPAVSAAQTTTDELGAVLIDSLDTGDYCMEISDGESTGSLLAFSIAHGNDDVRLPRDTLKAVGALRGTVVSGLHSAASSYIRFYGLERSIKIDSLSGNFALTDLPAGTYSLSFATSDPNVGARTISSIVIASGKTTTIDTVFLSAQSILKYSAGIFFNTTSSGAGVSGNALDFPVLLRLNEGNFNFSQARGDGGDIRFFKPGGASLPYEIERWDSLNALAEIWIKVDTIFGNDAAQSVSMLWGNPLISGASNTALVFDTSAGFQGVWHLDETIAGGPNSVGDQTAHGYNGTPHGTVSGNAVEGIIGKAASFNGTDDYITIPRPIQDDFTIAFWMKADSESVSGAQWWDGAGLVDGDIAGVQDGDFGVAYLNSRPVFGTCCSDQTLDADKTVNDAQWHYVAVTRQKSDGTKTIYVDGVPQGSQIGTTLTLNGPDSLAFGKILAYASLFKGELDEIQISGIVRSADWIALCFANQSIANAFIQIRPNQ